MGNLMQLGESEEAPAGNAVHGVLHLLTNLDFAKLTNMEHEYWWVVPCTGRQQHGGCSRCTVR